MAKAFAAELGRHQIRVNSVHPTGVNTPMGSGNMQAEIGAAIAGDERLGAMFMNMMPVDITEPSDVADTPCCSLHLTNPGTLRRTSWRRMQASR